MLLDGGNISTHLKKGSFFPFPATNMDDDVAVGTRVRVVAPGSTHVNKEGNISDKSCSGKMCFVVFDDGTKGWVRTTSVEITRPTIPPQREGPTPPQPPHSASRPKQKRRRGESKEVSVDTIKAAFDGRTTVTKEEMEEILAGIGTLFLD